MRYTFTAMETGATGTEISKEIDEFEAEARRFLTGEVHPEKFKRFRLQHGIYGQRQPGVQMVRIKIPYGGMNPEQIRTIADISDEFAIHKGHVTTRQDIQLHFVKLQNVPEIMRRLAAVGVTTREACGNTVRNVVACHYAGICATELFDMTPYAHAVTYQLLRNPINQALPRKFKISFSGCPDRECGMAPIHDIGFIAASRPGSSGGMEYGFKVWVGGGLGSSPKLAKLYADFLPMSDLLITCEAILKVFDQNGDRKIRSKARMKFVVEKWGIGKFIVEVKKEIDILRESGKAYPALPEPMPAGPIGPPHPLTNGHAPPSHPEDSVFGGPAYGRFLKFNAMRQRQTGLSAVNVKLPLGDIRSDQMRALASIVERYSEGNVRTTNQQNFLMRNVRDQDLPGLFKELAAIGLAEAGAEQAVDVVVCPGADSCQLALTSSMGLAAAINEEFKKNLSEFEDLEGLRIRISGCPNSCGQHHVAPIGLHGVGKKVNGKLVPHYQLHLGGTADPVRPAIGVAKIKIPAKRLPAALMEMIAAYRENRLPGENYNAFIERFGRQAIEARLAKFTELPSPDVAQEFYRDWGNDEDFNLDDLGPGECAGTLIDDLEFKLKRGKDLLEDIRRHLAAGRLSEAIEAQNSAILSCARALLIPFGVDSPNDGDILKEFQHRVVEQGITSERFEEFTAELGRMAEVPLDAGIVGRRASSVEAFVAECHDAYDLLDANLKLQKREKTVQTEGDEGTLSPGEKNGKEAEVKIDDRIDLKGVACPMNFVKTKLRLEEMDAGKVLEVFIDEGEPERNVPRSVRDEGHKLLSVEKIDGYVRLLIEKV